MVVSEEGCDATRFISVPFPTQHACPCIIEPAGNSEWIEPQGGEGRLEEEVARRRMMAEIINQRDLLRMWDRWPTRRT